LGRRIKKKEEKQGLVMLYTAKDLKYFKSEINL